MLEREGVRYKKRFNTLHIIVHRRKTEFYLHVFLNKGLVGGNVAWLGFPEMRKMGNLWLA